ncbi:o-succinylbenzoate synthase [Erwinia sp. PK3-005]
MRQAKLWRYVIPMESGVVLRDRRLTQREGLLVMLQQQDRQGWGEIAPLPGFSSETLEQAQQACETWLTQWLTTQPVADSPLPSVAFGLSCACAELAGQLPSTGAWRSVQLCHGDPDALLLQLQAQKSPCAKMKVGLYEAIRDGLQVSLLLEALPDLQLRLDANRSWTLEKARQFALRLTPPQRARIAFIEEPCCTPAESLQFAAEWGIALAWDETLRQPDFRLQAAPGLAALVIKPTLTGSIAHVQQLIGEARRLGLQVVISSALESSLGLTQLARLAHWLTPQSPPGLDTLTLMRQQLVRRWPGCELPLQEPTAWTRIY